MKNENNYKKHKRRIKCSALNPGNVYEWKMFFFSFLNQFTETNYLKEPIHLPHSDRVILADPDDGLNI